MTNEYIYVLSELSLGENNLPEGWTPLKYCASGLAVWNYLTHNGQSHTKLSVRPTGEIDRNNIIEIIESSDSTELKRHNDAYSNPLIGDSSEKYDELFIVHRHEIFRSWKINSSLIKGGKEFVDLGLPSGLLWATCNVGATSPEKAGHYFGWGETVGCTSENVDAGECIYNMYYYVIGGSSSISADLTLKQDAAHVCMGHKWRMPTLDEYEELNDNCTPEWVYNYKGTGVAGMLLTSKVNGNSVFFPAAGGGIDSSVNNKGSEGWYWSASWYSELSAWSFYFDSEHGHLGRCRRCCGFSVRAVCER